MAVQNDRTRADKIQTAFRDFVSEMNAIRKENRALLTEVVGRIDRDELEQVYALIKSFQP